MKLPQNEINRLFFFLSHFASAFAMRDRASESEREKANKRNLIEQRCGKIHIACIRLNVMILSHK